MSDLSATSALRGYKRAWQGVSLAEIDAGELITLACAQGEANAFGTGFAETFGVSPPAPNTQITYAGGRVMWLEPDTYLVLQSETDIDADRKLGERFGPSAYAVLLTDGWTRLRLRGPRVHDVLERFTALDLRSQNSRFAARTTAHHMSVIIAATPDGYDLLTPRTSALSFLHGLETVTGHVCGPAARD